MSITEGYDSYRDANKDDQDCCARSNRIRSWPQNRGESIDNPNSYDEATSEDGKSEPLGGKEWQQFLAG